MPSIKRTYWNNTPRILTSVRDWGAARSVYHDAIIVSQAVGDTQQATIRVRAGSRIVGGFLKWARCFSMGGGVGDATITVGDAFTCNRFKAAQSLTFASCEAISRFDGADIPYYCLCDTDILLTFGNGSKATVITTAGANYTGLSIEGATTPITAGTITPALPLDHTWLPGPLVEIVVEVQEPE